ncbi:MAG TPA: ABC transporter permease [Stellaceae bacterium]|nr:ABC transporter permease [Stellaceae bacterium]
MGETQAEATTQGMDIRNRRHFPANLVIGGAVVAVFIVLAAAGPWIAPFPFDQFDMRARFAPPGGLHWFGTDEFGRDVLSRVLAGAPYSLIMGFGATAISLIVGVPLGLLAAYHRGALGELIMRTVDLMISVPPILLGLLILAVTEPSLWKTILAVGIVYIPIMTRITRSVALGLLVEDFVVAARARGEGAAYIVFSEILPNAWSSAKSSPMLGHPSLSRPVYGLPLPFFSDRRCRSSGSARNRP